MSTGGGSGCPKYLLEEHRFCELPISGEHGIGYCRNHSIEVLLVRPELRPAKVRPLCSCGCGRPVRARGLSSVCYMREYDRLKRGQPSAFDRVLTVVSVRAVEEPRQQHRGAPVRRDRVQELYAVDRADLARLCGNLVARGMARHTDDGELEVGEFEPCRRGDRFLVRFREGNSRTTEARSA